MSNSNERLTDEQLVAIRERVDAATPGPWEYDGDPLKAETSMTVWKRQQRGRRTTFDAIVHPSLSSSDGMPFTGILHRAHKDCQFIAHAPADVISLLAEVGRLRAENAELERDRVSVLEAFGQSERLNAKMRRIVEALADGRVFFGEVPADAIEQYTCITLPDHSADWMEKARALVAQWDEPPTPTTQQREGTDLLDEHDMQCTCSACLRAAGYGRQTE